MTAERETVSPTAARELESIRAAERDGYADGSENVVWRAQRHPVSRRLDYERGFQRGQVVYHRGHPRMGDHALDCPAWAGSVCRCGVSKQPDAG